MSSRVVRNIFPREVRLLGACAFPLALLASCAVVEPPPKPVVNPLSQEEQRAAQVRATAPQEKSYKRKVAVGRFTNESTYGRGLLLDADLDPLGKQAADILSTELQRMGRFIIFERPDIEKVRREQGILGKGKMVGVDTLIIGSVTEFGRVTEGKTGFLSSTKRQRVRAKVNMRLVDVVTGRVFFGADGAGEAITETGEVAGFGSRANYDSTLNEKAISAAITDVLDEVVTELERRPWNAYVLDVQDGRVFITGGARQGLKVGDQLEVVRRGKIVESPESGMPIQLPGTAIARIRVLSHFGDDEATEGSVCEIVSGAVAPENRAGLIVVEVDQ